MPTEKEKLIFWLPTYPEIMESLMIALADTYDVQIFCLSGLLRERQDMYANSRLGRACRVHFVAEDADLSAYARPIIEENREAVHVFGGFLGKVGAVMRLYHECGLKQGVVLTEKPGFVPAKRFNRVVRMLKGLRARQLYGGAYRQVADALCGVAVTGQSGVKMLRSYGIPENKLFPFMYTHIDETPSGDNSIPTENASTVRFLYVGRFEYLNRGMDSLINAFRDRSETNWTLDLVGGYGEAAEEIIRWAESTERVNYIGKWPSDEVIARMRRYDVCVSPTRLDGWRIQVNQAIMAGIATLTTNEAVSDELVRASGSGMVVDAFRNRELREAITQILKDPAVITEWKANARAFAPRITNEAAAAYFSEILQFSISRKGGKPSCPWIDPTI